MPRPKLPPKLTLRLVAVGKVRADPRNTRRHTERNLASIEASLSRFGQRKPLVVTKDLQVVAGNGTLEVIRDRLGWDRVWVSVYDGTPEQARAYGIADNRTGELAGWDEQALARVLAETPPDLLDSLGFTAGEAEKLTERLLAAVDRQSIHGDPVFHGQQPTSGLAAQGEKYEDKPTRTIYFELPKATFEWINDRLGEYRAAHELPGNAAAFTAMVAEASGTDIPTTDEDEGARA